MKKLNLLVIAIVFTIGLRAQTVQEKLDSGVPIEQIIATLQTQYGITKNTATDSIYDKKYHGGLIIHVDQNAYSGYICDTVDLPGTYSLAPGNGNPLYAAIQNLPFDGLSYWMEPSYDHVDWMYYRVHIRGLGNFSTTTWYWSSTSWSPNYFKALNFNPHFWYSRHQDSLYLIRPVKYFYPSVITSVDEVSSDTKTKVYPNPVVNILTVEVDNQSVYNLYSVDGKPIRIGTFSEGKNIIDSSELPLGTYLLEVKNNRSVTYSKIIKK